MIYDFSVYFKDECIADVHIDTEKNETSIKRYILGPKQPFMCERQDIHYIYGFLESRCFDNGWPDMPPILKANETNPTHMNGVEKHMVLCTMIFGGSDSQMKTSRGMM